VVAEAEDIPAGYKRTEVGVIPDDWDVVILTDLCGFKNGGAHEPFIDPEGEFICVNSKFISTEGKVRKRSLKNLTPARTGDVLIVMSDLPNGKALAKTFLVDRDDLYAVNQRIGRLSPRSGSSKFLSATLNRNLYFLKFDDGVSQTHLLNPVFKECLVPQPSEIEQSVIAEALTDTDEAIRALEAVIAKKRNVKQATLHALLIPTRRLPGFNGEWVESTLGKIANIVRGASPRPISDPKWFELESNIGWVRISDVTSSKRVLSDTTQKLSNLGILNSRYVSADNLIMSICATVGRPIVTKIDVCIHDGFVVFENLKASQSFIFYLLCELEKWWGDMGQTGSQMNLNTEMIKSKEIRLPSLPEQTAIASVLSDMDNEIEALEARLDKLRDIKQGMTQVLLTGKVRLV